MAMDANNNLRPYSAHQTIDQVGIPSPPFDGNAYQLETAKS